MRTALAVLGSVMPAACFQSPGALEVCTFSDPTFCDAPDASTSAGTSTTGDGTGSSGVTSGGATDSTGTGTSTEADTGADTGTAKPDVALDLPPTVQDLALDPVNAFEVGPTLVYYTASDDAVAAQLLDDGAVVAEGPIGEPLVFPVTSAPHNNPGSTLTVVVRDQAGQTASAEIYQPSNVKAQGSAVWTTQEPGDGAFSIGAAVALQGSLAVVAGVRFHNGKLVGTVRLYDQAGKWKDTDVGWTMDHPEWTTIPELASGQLSLSAVAVDGEGAIIVAGTALVDNKQRMYLVRFNKDGSRDWEILEGVGTSGRGLAVQSDGTIYVTGSKITNAAPEQTDLITWVYDKDRTAHGPDTYKDPEDQFNDRSERGRAATVLDDGRVVVVGMAVIPDPDMMNELRLRTVAITYEGKGTRIKTWISPGDTMPHDAGLAVTRTAEGLALCGYASETDDPADKSQIHIRWLSTDLEEYAAPRLVQTPGSAKCNAISYNREGSVIVGAEVNEPSNGWIFALPDALSQSVDYLKFDGAEGGDDRVVGLSCDYTCAWVGAEEIDNAAQWIAGMIRA